MSPRPKPSPKPTRKPAVLALSIAAPAKSYAVALGAGLSVLAHAVLLASGFINVPAGGKQQDRGLQIVLVNAKHARSPRDAQAIAQANMDGGGNTDSKDLSSSPLPPEQREQLGDSLSDASRRVQELEARQQALLAQAKSAAAITPSSGKRSPQGAQAAAPRDGNALDDKSRVMSQQEAVVEQMLRQYAQRPRKTVIAPRTRESRFALYAESWRKTVQDMGTLKFPKDVNGKPIYGSVMLSVEINRYGKVLEVKVERSSGSRRLDEAAVRIVHMASPFKPFPPEVARDTDILALVRTFNFQQSFGDAVVDVKDALAR
ncbi:energy transducer TonB [Uliginosibacterium sediminicola]|uniref:Energy transducer TonB n=1 Tax=Uliginosibacterium sediminicola TaxID=2024550 RepID=A0ABU9YTU0_9RHOO